MNKCCENVKKRKQSGGKAKGMDKAKNQIKINSIHTCLKDIMVFNVFLFN